MRALKILTVISFVLALCVVVLGAYTRLADAGLGCPDWPTCYGHLWVPDSQEEVKNANLKFAETPVEHDKTWPEQSHRLVASSLGIFILAMFFVANGIRAKAQKTKYWNSVAVSLVVLIASTIARISFGDVLDIPLLVLAAAYFVNLIRFSKQNVSVPNFPYIVIGLLAGLVILQGWFGMWTVTLKLWPQVVTLHLLGGFATLSLIFLSGLFLFNSQRRGRLVGFKRIIQVSLIIVCAQIMLGGWTTSNYAALACIDFPTCHGEIIPEMDFLHGFNIFQSVGPNYLGGNLRGDGRTAIHMMHRAGAIFVLISVGLLTLLLLRKKFIALSLLTGTVLLVQIGLGIANIVLYLPLLNAVAHNFVGALLLLVMVLLRFTASNSQGEKGVS
jgi:cytochrome c oxidase assembly protein subunit 15